MASRKRKKPVRAELQATPYWAVYSCGHVLSWRDECDRDIAAVFTDQSLAIDIASVDPGKRVVREVRIVPVQKPKRRKRGGT